MIADSEDRRFYVYVKFRPWDGSPCYVGKGQGARAWEHEIRTINGHLRNIIKKAGGSIPTVIIRDGMTEEEAFSLEIVLIKAIGRRDKGLGPLVNFTDGGEGTSAISEEIRLRKNANISKSNTGKRQSPETRAKLSFIQKGKVISLETRAKMSETRKRLYREDPAFRKAISLGLALGRAAGPAAISKRSKEDEAFRLSLGDHRRGTKLSEEHRLRIKEGQAKRRMSIHG